MYDTLWGKSADLFGLRSGIWGRRWEARVPFEALVWIVGLGAMALMNPEGQHLFSLCPLDALGISFCPGCGLGHAIAYLARGQLWASIQAHPLGIPAVAILIHHVIRLIWTTDSADAFHHS